MKVYLDMCCYNRPYDPQDQMSISLETQAKLFIQDWIKSGKLALVASYTLDYEVSNVPQIISIILREQFDYTKWQREYYDAMKPGEFMKNAAEYAKLHPFEGQAKRVRVEQGQP